LFGPRRATWCITVEIFVLRLATFKRSRTETTPVASPSSTRASLRMDSLRYPTTFATGSLDGKMIASVRRSVTGMLLSCSGFVAKSPQGRRKRLSI
jgi:hypothetical protein